MTIRLEPSLAYRVHRAARALRRHFLQIAARLGLDLTPEMWWVLVKLVERDGQSQVELCEEIFSDRPNLTRMLTAMESRGLVRRGGDPADARRTLVFLTAEGRKAQARFAAGVEAERATLFAGITPDDLATTLRALDTLERNLSPD